MRTTTKIAAGVAALALAATTAACSSSGDKKPVGSFKTLTGQSTTVVASNDFVSALTALKLTPGLTGKATMPSTGQFSFPITGGNATIYKKGDVKPYVQGVIDHQGSGLSLTSGKTTVDLQNFVVHPGNGSHLNGDVTVNGGTPMKGVDLFRLDGTTLQTPTISKAGVATLQGTKIYLTAGAANALNSVFKTTAVKPNLYIGYAVIKATGK